jgi:hypothetical protein
MPMPSPMPESEPEPDAETESEADAEPESETESETESEAEPGRCGRRTAGGTRAHVRDEGCPEATAGGAKTPDCGREHSGDGRGAGISAYLAVAQRRARGLACRTRW